MLDTDSASDSSTVLNSITVGVKNSNFNGVNRGINSDEEKKEIEASESSSDEISRLGEDLHDSNTLYQDRIEEKSSMIRQEKTQSLQQMIKLQTNEVQNLRESLFQKQEGQATGSNLSSAEQKLASENKVLTQTNELLILRLYNAVSMLEVEEDYCVELEAKIARLEQKQKEQEDEIERLSAKSNTQMTKEETLSSSPPPTEKKDSYSELNRRLETSGTKTVVSNAASLWEKKLEDVRALVKGPERNQQQTQPDQRPAGGRRGLFKRSDSIGDLDYVGGLGISGPLASVLSGGNLSDQDSEVPLHSAKQHDKRSVTKRSMSLRDLSCDDDDNLDTMPSFTLRKSRSKDELGGSLHTSLSKKSRRKDELGGSLHTSLSKKKNRRKDELGGSLHTSLSKKSKSKQKASKKKSLWDLSDSQDMDMDVSSHSTTSKKKKSSRKKGSLDSASMHSTFAPSKSKDKKRDRRSGLKKCNSLGDLMGSMDDSSSSSGDESFAGSDKEEVVAPRARGGRPAFKRSSSVGANLVSERDIRRAFSSRDLMASLTDETKSKKKTVKGKKVEMKRCSSHGDLVDGDSDISLGDSLGSSIHSIHSTSSKTKKRRTKPKKSGQELKFGSKQKRRHSAGDLKCSLLGEDKDDEEEATDALKFLIDDLWSKRKETPAAGKRIELGENLEALLKPKKLSPNLLTSLSQSTKPRATLRLSKSSTIEQGGSTKNATWD